MNRLLKWAIIFLLIFLLASYALLITNCQKVTVITGSSPEKVEDGTVRILNDSEIAPVKRR